MTFKGPFQPKLFYESVTELTPCAVLSPFSQQPPCPGDRHNLQAPGCPCRRADCFPSRGENRSPFRRAEEVDAEYADWQPASGQRSEPVQAGPQDCSEWNHSTAWGWAGREHWANLLPYLAMLKGDNSHSTVDFFSG